MSFRHLPYEIRMRCASAAGLSREELLSQVSSPTRELRLLALVELATREVESASDEEIPALADIFSFLEFRVSQRKKTRRGQLRARTAPTVYFIQQRAESGQGPIKIGWSRDVEGRLGSLQTNTPHRLDILATVAGGEQIEKVLHAFFDDERMSGEWFRPSARLIRFIAEILSAPDDTLTALLDGRWQ